MEETPSSIIGSGVSPVSDDIHDTAYALRYGFLIERFTELDSWKIITIDRTIPFAIQRLCPACDRELAILCTLVDGKGVNKIRIGCCSECGYVGYVDRPTHAWLSSFYAENWDNAAIVNSEAKAAGRRKKFQEGGIAEDGSKVRGKEMTALFTRFPIPRHRPVLEIGCGYGQGLKFLEQLGFQKLYGMEASLHRAYVASHAYDLSVYAGAFEDEAVQTKLGASAPFGLIFSHHVMEHVYNPEETLRRAANLQQEGDYLLTSMPNMIGEPSMATLLFFPHLHAFTKESFVRLLGRNGYTLVDDTFTKDKELFLLARKGKGSAHVAHAPVDHRVQALAKLVSTMGLCKRYYWPRRRLWWCRNPGRMSGGQMPFLGNAWMDRAAYWMRFADHHFLRKKIPDTQSCIVRGLTHRYTSFKESPLEIQFEGDIKLAYK